MLRAAATAKRLPGHHRLTTFETLSHLFLKPEPIVLGANCALVTRTPSVHSYQLLNYVEPQESLADNYLVPVIQNLARSGVKPFSAVNERAVGGS